MLFRTSTLRSRLALCAASVALVSGLAASPADAGSKKKLWLQENGSVVSPGNQGRREGKPGRGQQPGEGRGAGIGLPPLDARHHGLGGRRAPRAFGASFPPQAAAARKKMIPLPR